MIAGIVTKLFGGSWLGAGIAGLFLALAVASASIILYQKYMIIDPAEAKIERLTGQVADIKSKLDQAEGINRNLNQVMADRDRQFQDAIRQQEQTRISDETKTQTIRELEATLRDKERIQRVEAIRESEKSSLLVGIINSNVRCLMANFGRTDGRCVAGRWVQ